MGDPKMGRNPEAASKGEARENPRPGPDITGKLGKDGKLTLQECQHHMDNSLGLFCRTTGHTAKEYLKSTTIAAQAHTAIMELEASFIEEVKKD